MTKTSNALTSTTEITCDLIINGGPSYSDYEVILVNDTIVQWFTQFCLKSQKH